MNGPDGPLEAVLPAPAKINLFLRITGRRADGYHLLQSVFQFIDLCDRVHLRVRADGQMRRTLDLPGVSAEQDLTLRAARALQAHTGCALGVDISVDKHIPLGGGLGGGSSDAATVLVGLNRLWRLHLDEDTLAAIGLGLGADVPVFVRGRAAWAEGVGERLHPVCLDEPHYVLLLAPCAVPTAAVFGAADLTRDCPPLTIRGFPSRAGVLRARDLMRAGNVCEAVARRLYAPVGQCLDALAGREVARMSGTGAACFALASAAPDGLEALARTRGWTVHRVRGLVTSPLPGAVQRLRSARHIGV